MKLNIISKTWQRDLNEFYDYNNYETVHKKLTLKNSGKFFRKRNEIKFCKENILDKSQNSLKESDFLLDIQKINGKKYFSRILIKIVLFRQLFFEK